MSVKSLLQIDLTSSLTILLLCHYTSTLLGFFKESVEHLLNSGLMKPSTQTSQQQFQSSRQVRTEAALHAECGSVRWPLFTAER